MGLVLDLASIDRTQVALAGGKAAGLGELARIPGVHVPPGFCVTTDAYRRAMGAAGIAPLIARLPAAAGEIRAALENAAVPADLEAEVTRALHTLGEGPCAVRSSATAEDLPGASFAGQHDSYLDLTGPAEILRHVRRCWASLFTDRAVAYRTRGGFDHRRVAMAVIVQRLVPARAAGVLFTADPVTGNRRLATVEAVRGLGEALVSGTVSADVFTVRGGEVVSSRTGDEPAIDPARVVELVALGRAIEAHLGAPQDVEWCLADDGFQLVQARPITTLFPIPEERDAENHVYVSVGHNQMMTDAMRPLGISVWQLITPAPMKVAGARLFVDVTRRLASEASRGPLLELMGRGDPLVRDALETVLARGFVAAVADEPPASPPPAPPPPLPTDPAVVAELIARTQASLAGLRRDIQGLEGPALLDFVLADIQELRRLLFDPRSHQATMAGIEATWWLNDHLAEWLGEKDAADALAQSAPGNVTSEMGLALLDVADAIRPHPEVVAFLRGAPAEFLDRLPDLPGGREARAAIVGFLETYGMRCAGEIDVTRPRWSERPATLLPVLLGHVDAFAPGEARRRFERGQREAERREREILGRLRTQQGGEPRAAETKQMIDRLRTFIGFREYPKYGMVCRLFAYKQALLEEAGRLVRAGVLQEMEDIFDLTLQELQEVVRTQGADRALIRGRREAFRSYERLAPPRVLTSEGERVAGSYGRRAAPPGALLGLAVSSGTVEGRARVVARMEDAALAPGDILVTAYTDPSWTPLFVSIAGLVTEVGGVMTHGAVIAREYGLPAVVGVEGATRLVRDGRRIRVHGAEGFVELLE